MTKRQHTSADLDPLASYSPADDEPAGEAGFERIRRSSERPTTPKLDRRQQDKEWGKQINKFHKQRRKVERNQKP